MRKRTILALALAACGHTKATDPAAAPPPWPAETAPPPAREPGSQGAAPGSASPGGATVEKVTSAPAAAPSVEAPESPRVPKDRELPGEGPSRPFALPRPQRGKLASGAELLLVRRARLPLTTVVMVWPHGASSEPLDRAGIATLCANLLTEGAGKRSGLELAAEVEKLGARVSARASWDATTVSLSVLTRSLDGALALLSDVALRPRFDASEVERVRKEAKTTLLQLGDSASTQASLGGARALYGAGDRYAELLQGSEAGLTAATRDDIVAWHAQRLALSRATIIAVGDVDLPTLMRKLDRAFGAATPALAPLPPAPARNAPLASKARTIFVDRPGAAQTELRVFQPGPPRSSPDYFPLVLMNTILGGNFSSRLNAKLREEKGYTYGARSDFAFRRDGGPFVAGAPVKTAVTRAALLDLRAELTRMSAGTVSDAELRLAKATLQRSLARGFETAPEVALALALVKVYGLPESYYSTYTQNIEAVTPADIARVAKQLRPADMVVVLVGDEKLLGPDLKRELGTYERLGPPAK